LGTTGKWVDENRNRKYCSSSDVGISCCVEVTCAADEFRCATGTQCVDPYAQCNGVPDCDDGSDETVELCGMCFHYLLTSHTSPCRLNQLPASFRQPNPDHSSSHSSQNNHSSSSLPSCDGLPVRVKY